MRKKEHISNCEIAKKIIPFYNSYNYAGLRSKGNTYAYDDFCVSDDEYDSGDVDDENINSINDNDYTDAKINDNFNIESLNEERNKDTDDQYHSYNNYIENVFSSQEIIQKTKEKKKRKNVILESSYDSDESLKSIDSDEENSNIKKESLNDENLKENDDIFNSDLEIFSSSPVLPSLDLCMDKLFNNNDKDNDNKIKKRINKVEEKIKPVNLYDDFTISEELLGNNNKTKQKEFNELNNINIKDPLNLFSKEEKDSFVQSLDIVNRNSDIVEKSNNEDKLLVDNTIVNNEDTYEMSMNDNSILKVNREHIENTCEKTNNEDNYNSNYDANKSIKKPLSNLFSNCVDSDKVFKTSQKNKQISVENINKKQEYIITKERQNNGELGEENISKLKNNNIKYNDSALTSDTNDEINDLLNLFSNDVKDSSVVDSDEEFFMSSNADNNDKLNVKSLYSISNDSKNVNNNKTIYHEMDNSSNNNDNNSFNELYNNDGKEKEKMKAEEELLQLFDDEINNPINNHKESSDEDDNYNLLSAKSSNNNKKKYYKQASIKEAINQQKAKDEENLINLFTSENEGKRRLLEESKFKSKEDDFENFINSSIKKKHEKIKLSLHRTHPKKNKLEFYFKELSSSSSSNTTSSSNQTKNKTEENDAYSKTLYYNVLKNKKRTNEDDTSKNPFVITKKQKTKDKIKSNHNKQNSFNNILLKFESNSNENETPQTSLNSNSSSSSLSSKKKQKKQLSILSLFSSQSKNVKDNQTSPIQSDVYNSVINSLSKPRKSNGSIIQKSKPNNIRIRTRQNRLKTRDNNDGINPLVYILTCNKKSDSLYINPNTNKRGILRPQPIVTFSCQELNHSIKPTNDVINSNTHYPIDSKSNTVNDNYDLMKNRITKNKERSLVNNFITSFEEKSDKKRNRTWPPIGWNSYFQNSIENTF